MAAGAAASLLAGSSDGGAQKYTTTRELIAGDGLRDLIELLRSDDIQQPLEWG